MKKWGKRIIISFILIPTLLFSVAIAILYIKQDEIVKELTAKFNEDFKADIKIGDSHISPFAAFPYISIDIDNLEVYPTKLNKKNALIKLKDIYIGFDLFKLISGQIDIKTIKLENGAIHVTQDINGNLDIVEAFATQKNIPDAEEEFHLNLRSIILENIDVTKTNKQNNITIESFINYANSNFKTSNEHLLVGLNAKLVLNVIDGADTTFFKHKHISINAQLDYFKKNNKIVLSPSTLELEKAAMNMQGDILLNNDMKVNLTLSGNMPNFDILFAFAPEELLPVLKKYDNKGNIHFDAIIKGKTTDGNIPFINLNFACEHAFLNNMETNKKIDDINFKANLTNNGKKGIEEFQFSLTNFSSKPGAGNFSGNLKLKNFIAPEIDTKIISDFDLDFLAKFLNLKELIDLKGKINLTLNFKDIIDFSNPEKVIEKFNESYFTELIVKDLSFGSKIFHVPIKDVNIHVTVDGHIADIKKFDAKIGRSDISIKGNISDLPAIIHHTKNDVTAEIDIRSKLLDIKELTSGDTSKSKPYDEQIENLALKLRFKSSAKAFTESPNIPVGEFFIDNMYAKLKHYPHTLHDFHADILIDTSNFRVIDFSGLLDKSDFHFNGNLTHYDLWFSDHPFGDTRIEFDLTSKMLKLHDIFSYKGENYVPENYRNEELSELKLHGSTNLHFKDKLYSSDLVVEQFSSKMKLHKYKFEKFKGKILYENEHIMVQDFQCKLGKSIFELDINYYLGNDKTIKKRDNHFGIKSNRLDMDELFTYNPSSKNTTSLEHEKGFNIYELPFTDMTFDLDIEHLNYHNYLTHNIKGKFKSTENHFLYIDTLQMLIADGKLDISGYFNGSNKDKIYFSPTLKIQKIDLDKLLLKFDNFGQDYLVSENIHGKLSGKINGKIHVHPDMIPILEDSEIHMNLEITDGRLEEYEPLKAMEEYFKDKNMNKVFFDTLKNQIDLNNGTLSMPLMTINSSLGFMEVSGTQDINFNMEYYFKIPLELVSNAAKNKLFGSNNNEKKSEEENEIQFKDETKKTKYISLKLTGKEGNYTVKIGKEKK